MAKKVPPGKKAQAAETGYNLTDSGPANDPAGGQGSGEGVAKAAAVGKLASDMPYNPNKEAEHGHANALTPPTGASVKPTSRDATGSTLAEKNHTEKYGAPAEPGVNAAGGCLERVRADPEGQALTTNQGVKVSDNQNSLKAGLRGPALLKDFILREKLRILTTSAFPSGSCMLEVRAHMAISNVMSLWAN